jgi:thymidylate synthase (FAD)
LRRSRKKSRREKQMKIIKPSYEILTPIDGGEILKNIEVVARTCYKSHDCIKEGSAEKLVAALIKNQHEAMLEFFDITVKFICDRGVSHELVRHRTGNYAQESQRYVNYAKDKFDNQLTFIKPIWFTNIEEGFYDKSYYSQLEVNGRYATGLTAIENEFLYHMLEVEDLYLTMVRQYHLTPQEARAVLPNAVKTEINVKNDIRNWRHFFKLRTATSAHPQMRELTIPLLEELKSKIPVLFDDINVEV